MKIELYTITTLSNLHVGSGDINFDVIDNQVQRDNITKLPNINSSSLKGAFREHFSQEGESNMVKYIFGPDNKENDSHQTGAFSFFEAQLLSRPARSNKLPYFEVTSPEIIKELIEKIETLHIEVSFLEELKKFYDAIKNITKTTVFQDFGRDLMIEDENDIAIKNLSDTFSLFNVENLAVMPFSTFQELDLPVYARNYLEDGTSKNLWYEEVVPKQSKFYFCIAKPTNVDEKDYAQKIKGFENRFNKEGEIVQIGANKSIGYGFCKVERV